MLEDGLASALSNASKMPRLDKSYTIARPDGPRTIRLSLDPEQMSQRIMLEYLDAGKLYEQETCQFLAAILQDGDAFIDVGAHVGWFTTFAAALVGPTGEVWSVEPNRSNFAHLIDHIALNEAWHVRPLHMAMGSRRTVEPLGIASDNDGGHAVRTVGDAMQRTEALNAPDVQPTYVGTLDDLLLHRPFTSLKAIKLDAEGAEHAIMQGAEQLLMRHRVPFVIAEMNEACLQLAGSSEMSFRAFMTSLGYTTHFFHPNKPELVTLEPGQTVRSEVLLNFCFRRSDAPAFAT